MKKKKRLIMMKKKKMIMKTLLLLLKNNFLLLKKSTNNLMNLIHLLLHQLKINKREILFSINHKKLMTNIKTYELKYLIKIN